MILAETLSVLPFTASTVVPDLGFGTFMLVGIVFMFAILSPFLVSSFLRARRQRREELRRRQKMIREKQHSNVRLDLSKPPKGKLKNVRVRKMALGLNKLVRTGTPYDRG